MHWIQEKSPSTIATKIATTKIVTTKIVTTEMVATKVAIGCLLFITGAATINGGFLTVTKTIVAMPNVLPTDWSGVDIEP